MTNAEKIAQYAVAAAKCGQPVKSIVIEKGRVAVTYMPPAVIEDDGEGLAKDWTPKQ